MILSLFGATAGLQAAIYGMFGDPDKGDNPYTWSNEISRRGDIDVTPLVRQFPWRDTDDGARYYVPLGKQAREVTRWVTNPLEQLLHKASPAVRTVMEQATGVEPGGYPTAFADAEFWESIPDRAKSVGEKFIPFSFQGNNFAFALPLRKGMTYYRARETMANILEHHADPGLLRKLGAKPDDVVKLEDLVAQVTAAAQANNLDADRIFRDARAQVRSRYYKNFFAALEAGSVGKLNAAAESIVRLDAGFDNIKRSARARGIQMTSEQYGMFGDALRRAQETVHEKH
jgi:hypothetical protein